MNRTVTISCISRYDALGRLLNPEPDKPIEQIKYEELKTKLKQLDDDLTLGNYPPETKAALEQARLQEMRMFPRIRADWVNKEKNDRRSKGTKMVRRLVPWADHSFRNAWKIKNARGPRART